jgi:hypothetical protein
MVRTIPFHFFKGHQFNLIAGCVSGGRYAYVKRSRSAANRLSDWSAAESSKEVQ